MLGDKERERRDEVSFMKFLCGKLRERKRKEKEKKEKERKKRKEREKIRGRKWQRK